MVVLDAALAACGRGSADLALRRVALELRRGCAVRAGELLGGFASKAEKSARSILSASELWKTREVVFGGTLVESGGVLVLFWWILDSKRLEDGHFPACSGGMFNDSGRRYARLCEAYCRNVSSL